MRRPRLLHVTRFDVLVRRTASTSARARALVAARVAGVLRVLRRARIDEAAIRTEHLSVRRVRVRRDGRVRNLVRVETLLSVRSVPVGRVVALIDDVADAAATCRVSSSPSPTPPRGDALRRARPSTTPVGGRTRPPRRRVSA